MFTGIIKYKAKFISLNKNKSKYFLTLSTTQKFTNKEIGTSISINGICLTLIKAKKLKNKYLIVFYLSPETLRLSNLRFLKKNEHINILIFPLSVRFKLSFRGSGSYTGILVRCVDCRYQK